MHLGADMVSHQPHDALAVGGREPLAGVGEAGGEPIDPEPAVRVEHHLDDGGLLEPGRDRRTQRGAKHAGAPRTGLGSDDLCGHRLPPSLERGRLRRRGTQAEQ